MIIVLIHFIRFKKRLHIKIVRKGFKYMGYLNVLHGGYKKVIKRLMYVRPPTKRFHEDVISNILHTTLSESLWQSF